MNVKRARAELQKLKESMVSARPVIVCVEAYRGETREQALERHGIEEWREGIIFVDFLCEADKHL